MPFTPTIDEEADGRAVRRDATTRIPASGTVPVVTISVSISIGAHGLWGTRTVASPTGAGIVASVASFVAPEGGLSRRAPTNRDAAALTASKLFLPAVGSQA